MQFFLMLVESFLIEVYDHGLKELSFGEQSALLDPTEVNCKVLEVGTHGGMADVPPDL